MIAPATAGLRGKHRGARHRHLEGLAFGWKRHRLAMADWHRYLDAMCAVDLRVSRTPMTTLFSGPSATVALRVVVLP